MTWPPIDPYHPPSSTAPLAGRTIAIIAIYLAAACLRGVVLAQLFSWFFAKLFWWDGGMQWYVGIGIILIIEVGRGYQLNGVKKEAKLWRAALVAFLGPLVILLAGWLVHLLASPIYYWW